MNKTSTVLISSWWQNTYDSMVYSG